MEEKQNNREPFWNWGKGLTVAIVAFVMVTTGVVVYISSLDFHLVSENHYKNAVEYQRHIDRVARTDALESEIHVTGETGSSDIRIEFPESQFSLSPTGMIRLYRPDNAGLDQTFELSLDRNGIQLLPAEQLRRGRWLVQITWQAGGEGYYKEVELFL